MILRASLGTFDGGLVQEKSWPAPYGSSGAGGLVDGMHLMTPETNLDVQTRIISAADAFVGTYGGFSYLAPLFRSQKMCAFMLRLK